MSRSGEVIDRSRDDLVFAHRQSNLDDLVVLRAEFQLEKDDREELDSQRTETVDREKAGQPLSHRAAGCIFKNPRGMGWR
jgi:UDP-N-acetylmuramate dehydrogenase